MSKLLIYYMLEYFLPEKNNFTVDFKVILLMEHFTIFFG